MDESFDLSDISWLTQLSKKEVTNFKIVDSSDSDDEFTILNQNVIKTKVCGDIINLEDGKEVVQKPLYDRVVCKDISSDENIDKM